MGGVRGDGQDINVGPVKKVPVEETVVAPAHMLRSTLEQIIAAF